MWADDDAPYTPDPHALDAALQARDAVPPAKIDLHSRAGRCCAGHFRPVVEEHPHVGSDDFPAQCLVACADCSVFDFNSVCHVPRASTYCLAALIASVSAGTTSNKSPTMP